MLTKLRDEMRALSELSPVRALAMYGVLVLIVVDTWMQVVAGYRKGGGDLQAQAIGYAAIMAALALLAVWVPWEAKSSTGRKAGALWVLSIPLFFLVQSNGWAVMGITVADGSIKRETRATTRSTLADDVKRLRDELAAISPPKRPVEAIQAALDLELRNTSRQYPDGDGPKALRIKEELATARRYAELPGLIDDAVKKLNDAPQVAGGGVDRAVLMALVDWLRSYYRGRPLREEERVTAAEVEAGMAVFLVGLIGFCAVFGPAIVLGPRKTAIATEPEPFDPRLLPPVERQRHLPPPGDAERGRIQGAPADGVTQTQPGKGGPEASGMQPLPVPLVPAAGGMGGGATNNIYVGGAHSPQHLPARVTAQRRRLLERR